MITFLRKDSRDTPLANFLLIVFSVALTPFVLLVITWGAIYLAIRWNTEFSEQFTEFDFWCIYSNQSADEVFNYIGRPILVSTVSGAFHTGPALDDGIERWCYSFPSDVHGSYIIKEVIINSTTNRVIDKRSKIYFD